MSRFRNSRILLLGIWVNRNWILGNLIRELHTRLPRHTRIWWIFSAFLKGRRVEQILSFPLPKSETYFFPFPSIFRNYLARNSTRFENKSIVLYTHNEPELGDLGDQAKLLNKAFVTYFMNSRDAEVLISHGLSRDKTRVVFFGIDTECVKLGHQSRVERSVVLASRSGPRKGLELLPEVVRALPEWSFTLLGRNWENFIKDSGLKHFENFSYQELSKESRTKVFSQNQVFLSLSNLEGGPIPLIEAITLGLIPISTDTGFARDFIKDGENGFLLSTTPSVKEVKTAILNSSKIAPIESSQVNHLTWDRLAKILLTDHLEICHQNKLPRFL